MTLGPQDLGNRDRRPTQPRLAGSRGWRPRDLGSRDVKRPHSQAWKARGPSTHLAELGRRRARSGWEVGYRAEFQGRGHERVAWGPQCLLNTGTTAGDPVKLGTEFEGCGE